MLAHFSPINFKPWYPAMYVLVLAVFRVWSLKTGDLLNTLIHHCEAVLHLRFSDGIMVTCSKVMSADHNSIGQVRNLWSRCHLTATDTRCPALLSTFGHDPLSQVAHRSGKVMENKPNGCCILDPCTCFRASHTLSLSTVCQIHFDLLFSVITNCVTYSVLCTTCFFCFYWLIWYL